MKNKLNRLFSYWLLAISCWLISSCQKVININLNSASPQIVVQGNLSNQPAPYTVQLSQTVNFSDPNTFPTVSGVKMIINDNAGNTDTLKENPAGIYTGTKLIGTPNRTYTLLFSAMGKNYTSVSTMPSPVNIDSLAITKSLFGKKKQVSVIFNDPAGIPNYYRLVEIVNHVMQNSTQVLSDELLDGQTITTRVSSRSDTLTLRTGDSITVLLESIDKGVYTHYISLQNASGGSGQISPANPSSNVSNSALGYFCAYSVTTKSIVVP